MEETIEEHDRDIWLARSQISAISDLAHQTGYKSVTDPDLS